MNTAKGEIIIIEIGQAYYHNGFFNIRKQHSDFFGKDGSSVRIILGEHSDQVIDAYVNRRANPNSTPRIMAGKEYKAWIQQNFRQGDVFKVHIISENFIQLTK